MVQPKAVGGTSQLQSTQQYMPVTMVEQNGRQMLAAVQAQAWPSRQMTLAVPSWQQLAASTQATSEGLLQPLFASANESDWHNSLFVDSSGNIRLPEQTVFPVVYDRSALVANHVATLSSDAALLQSQRSYAAATSSSKRSTKYSQYTSQSINSVAQSASNNPPPAHLSSHIYNDVRYIKKEAAQHSPVKKRIKESKEQFAVPENYLSSASQSPLEQPKHLPSFNTSLFIAGNNNLNNSSSHVTEVITISDSEDDSPPAHEQVWFIFKKSWILGYLSILYSMYL